MTRSSWMRHRLLPACRNEAGLTKGRGKCRKLTRAWLRGCEDHRGQTSEEIMSNNLKLQSHAGL